MQNTPEKKEVINEDQMQILDDLGNFGQTKKVQPIGTKKFLKINLLEKYSEEIADEYREATKEYMTRRGYNDTENAEIGVKVGDLVTFIGGYNSDIIYTTEVLGFDEDKDLIVLWDCYWFAVKAERIIKK